MNERQAEIKVLQDIITNENWGIISYAAMIEDLYHQISIMRKNEIERLNTACSSLGKAADRLAGLN